MGTEQVTPEERLSRFIFSTNHFSILYQRVKYAAFLPRLDGKTSVFRTSNKADKEIWDTGDKEVAQKRNKPIHGRADILAVNALNSDLNIVPDDTPPGHANIIGWPDEKSEQKLIAMELAEKASLHLK